MNNLSRLSQNRAPLHCTPKGLRRGKASLFPTRPRPTRPPCLRGLTRTETRSAASAVARPPTSLGDQLRLNRQRRRRGLGNVQSPPLPLHPLPLSPNR